MTLLDAKEYHPEKERKKRIRIISAIVLVLVLALLGWWNRFWPEKRVADKFFSALQKQDFEAAFRSEEDQNYFRNRSCFSAGLAGLVESLLAGKTGCR